MLKVLNVLKGNKEKGKRTQENDEKNSLIKENVSLNGVVFN